MPNSDRGIAGATLAAVEHDLPTHFANDPQAHALPPVPTASAQGIAPVPSTFAFSSAAASGIASDLASPVASLDAITFARRASMLVPNRVAQPLLGPLGDPATSPDFGPRAPRVVAAPLVLPGLAAARPRRVDHRAWQTDLVSSQGSRGTCWAFAGTAALEAAYARTGVRVKLSEHYLFHISKAHECQRTGTGINSLHGFQGSSDIVHHLKYWHLPLYAHAPYIDQPALQALADSIPGTGNALQSAGVGTLEQTDWFEYDLRSIPLNAVWFAQYSVATFGVLNNYSLDDLKKVLAAGYDVVINVPGHCMLCYGYDDDAGELLIKNSQSLPGFQRMKYSGDPNFSLLTGQAHYITSVRSPQTQWAAMWVGRWETDHDGWRGRLVIRRFLEVQTDKGLPTPNAPATLGTWYGADGQVLPVNGGFVDGGRGLRCTVGGQPFELYLHGRDPYRASGRVLWNNTWFGAVLSRGTAVGAGAGFDRSETIGLWDSVHDGWRGQMRIGVAPSYRQAADGAEKPAWIDSTSIAQQVDLNVDFGGDNRKQHFQLLHNTREDGLMGGVTQWDGRDWPVEARMSANLYAIRDDGTLNWYRHLGRYKRSFEWDPPKQVGTGWSGFNAVFGGGDGVIYVIRPDGKLVWYYHDGRNQGSFQWSGPKEVGTGWQGFSRVFAGEGGVIYVVQSNGDLIWYRHLGRRDGTFSWKGPFKVGTGWNSFVTLAAGPDGTIYGTLPDGRMLWYRHFGYDHGYPIWSGANPVGVGWQPIDRIWVAGNGFVYGRNRNGELWLWRHHGFQDGTGDWTPGAKVGTGWTGGVRDILLT